MQSGISTQFDIESGAEPKTHYFFPDNVRKVELRLDEAGALVKSIALSDSTQNLVDYAPATPLLHFSALQDKERIVGIVAHRVVTNGQITDLQFIIAKEV